MSKKFDTLPKGITEDQVKAKLAESLGQLTRDQAITVLQQQADHDAALAAEEEKTIKKKSK